MTDATRPPRGAPGDGRGRLINFPRERKSGLLPPQDNLPLQLTSFVGREREVAALEELLTTEARLLTLTGPGGSGKTRLALAVASLLASRFDDGVWWAELAPVSDPALVPQAVAQAMMIREESGRSLLETIARDLASTELLLVLDNCEHLVQGCASLADTLLHACPKLRILATSREALGIGGENTWLVPPLSLPDSEIRPSAEELSRYEAIRLFVERVRFVVPTFELTESNAPTVVRLCRMLDGMPLAVELAAARVRVLSVEQICSRLEDSFALLAGGGRNTLPRQRTLGATIDWSHDLLGEEEQVLFRRLSVFAGGFTLDAAEQVCGGNDLEHGEVLARLTSLIDKSLVGVVERDEAARYRMLETVRQYGREKLDESGEAPDTRRYHADFFLEFAEQVEPKINSKYRGLWLERLEVEHDNLRAALALSREEAESETGLRLSGALSWFWFHREYWSEWRGWLDTALATQEGGGRRPGLASPAARAKALCGRGFLAWMQGDQATARVRLEESVALWREIGDKQELAHALRFLSGSFESRGDYAEARPLAEESVELFREVADEFGLGITLSRLGITALAQGDHAAAQAYLEEGVAICREIEDDWALALALRNLGIGAFRQGDYEQAAARLEESLGVLEDTSNPLYMQNLELLAAAVSMQGNHRQAAWMFGAAEALREAVGAFVLPLYRAEYDRGVDAARTGLGEPAFEKARIEGRAISPEEAVEHALSKVEVPGSRSASATSYPAGLSAREAEVLKHVAKGLTNAHIAHELFISPRTVDRHLNSAYRKAGVSSRVEAARFASEHNLL